MSCFDKSSSFGGLWCYRSDVEDDEAQFEASVMRTTILNTSKELSALSDFPPPAELPNFMRHNLYMDYIRSYVKHFNLDKHINLRHQIASCQPEWNAERREIKWLVKIKRLEDGHEFEEKFDKLMVAIGHHNIPFAPTYRNQSKFGGQILHSARLKDIITSKRFVDKRVVVVGLGNSACDAANDISMVASKCYVSCHRGQWFTSRYLTSGPFDNLIKQRAFVSASKCVPNWLLSKKTVDLLERRTNHQMLGLKPRHTPLESVPAINDLFPYKVYTGGVVLKGAIASFSEDGNKVVFEGEEETEYEVDIVVMATGYEGRIVFMDESALGLRRREQAGNGESALGEYDLFLNIFAPNLTLPPPKDNQASESRDCCNANIDEPQRETVASKNGYISLKDKSESKLSSSIRWVDFKAPPEAIKSLALIGFIQPNGSMTVIAELQSRYAARVFAGRLDLPSEREMARHMEQMRRMRSKAVRSHSRDQLIGNYVSFADTIASLLGVKPCMGKLFLRDLPLWKKLYFGPSVPYQYRLSGPGEWAGARETIMKTNERIYCGINEGKNHILFKNRRKRLTDGKN